jgi:hypothetical protein
MKAEGPDHTGDSAAEFPRAPDSAAESGHHCRDGFGAHARFFGEGRCRGLRAIIAIAKKLDGFFSVIHIVYLAIQCISDYERKGKIS